MHTTIAVVIAAFLTVGALAAPAGAQEDGPVPVGYSPSGGGADVGLLPLDAGDGNGELEGTWRLDVAFDCEGQDVEGSVVITVDGRGRFEVETDDLVTQADSGSETETTIRGRVDADEARGTIDASARAYDNAGTTAECEQDGIRWRAEPTPRPDLVRVVGYVPAPGAELMAASDEAVFFGKDDGNHSGAVRRVSSGNETVWKTQVGIVTDLAVAGDRLWVANAGRGQLLGLNVETGQRVMDTTVAAGSFDGIQSEGPLAVTDTAILVGTNHGIVRVERTSGDVLATIGEGTFTTVASGPAGVFAIRTEVDADGRFTDASLVRVDEATGTVGVERPIPSTSAGLAVLDDAVALATSGEVIELLDPVTLETRGSSAEPSDGTVVAEAPGLWISTPDSLVALDSSGATVERLPGLTGALTTAPGIVWVLDSRARGAIGLRAG